MSISFKILRYTTPRPHKPKPKLTQNIENENSHRSQRLANRQFSAAFQSLASKLANYTTLTEATMNVHAV